MCRTANNALTAAEAEITSRQSQLEFSKTDFARGQELIKTGFITKQAFDQRRRNFDAAAAAVAGGDSAARSGQVRDQKLGGGSRAHPVDHHRSDLGFAAERRVQYLLARAGEVVAAGAPIVTILDLTDVYMTIFLPAADAGKLSIGDEARIILDPVPDYIIPAKVSFVAADAQFTPKTVETKDERTKLTFRIKLQVDPTVLQTFYKKVKTGIRGMGFVRTKANVDWPAELQIKLPDAPEVKAPDTQHRRRRRRLLSPTLKRLKRKRLMPNDRRADRAG